MNPTLMPELDLSPEELALLQEEDLRRASGQVWGRPPIGIKKPVLPSDIEPLLENPELTADERFELEEKLERLKQLPPLALQFAQWRYERGLSQSKVAQRAGLCSASISTLEGGYYHPGPGTSKKLADALEIDFDVFWKAVQISRTKARCRIRKIRGNSLDPDNAGFSMKCYMPLWLLEWIEQKAEDKAKRTGAQHKSVSGMATQLLLKAYYDENPGKKIIR